jgi:ubiquinone/menaquinone biosynthesis C-methylase UbiE
MVVGKEFRLIDGNRLDFADASFDGCRMDRVLHHLDDPARAFAELVRVARHGGRLVIHEPDFEMLAIDSPNRAVTRKVLNFFCDSHANGWAGRQLYGCARRAGLEDVRIEASTWVSTDYAEIRLRMRLEQTIAQAIAAGVLAAEEADDWLAGLRAEDDAGQFYWASTVFLLSGRKP